jgi:eukaryotic-like serine/threonine-protein kinase
MPLGNNTRLGPYEILAPIGAGGMGEVYRAKDSKLGRDVALKVLPEAFASDADRMARFQREAKLLASLNHTNIAAIHGLEDSGKTHALVMELVEGPTLADRIRLGPIPMDEALQIAKQIADALEYAHEHGVVHRDLKPANVKVTNDDAVKVLDFGLAKAIEGDAASADLANSPTMSRMATLAGVLLGTAAYMSPEQAKGKPVDRRADIWAFGCVLYEMLTGKMAFRGETVTDTLAAVIKEDPDWSRLPAGTPVRVRVLLQRCLQKDPKQRLRDIGDARISLEEVLSGAQEPALGAATPSATRRRLLWIVGGAAGAFIFATCLFAFLYLRQSQRPTLAQAVRFEVPLPEKTSFTGGAPSVSPDGRKLAFIATGADGQSRLWVRSLDTVEVKPLQGTEGANGWPFWSPDSSALAFVAAGKLMKMDISGGAPQALCDAPSIVFSGVWKADHQIIFSVIGQLLQVPDFGGTPSPVGPSGTGAFPSLLPDGQHFLYSVGPPGVPTAGIYVGTLESKPGEGLPSKLSKESSQAIYVPSPDSALGYVLFLRTAAGSTSSGTLMAMPFDAERLKMVGEPIPVAEQVRSFSASPTGVLVYWSGTSSVTGPSRGNIQGKLTWFDSTGKALGTIGDSGLYRTLAISPDGKRIAFERADPQNFSNRNIWIYDLARGVTTRFTFGTGWDANPVWSPDGSRIAFGGLRTGKFDIYQKASNLAGEDELVFTSGAQKLPSSWSPDGRFLLFYSPVGATHVWVLPLDGPAADRKPFPLEQSEFFQAVGRFSPDGRWIAYQSNESGKDEVYVRPFGATSAGGVSSPTGSSIAGKWMVSKDGGEVPLWRRDGKELFYISPNGMAMAVDVNTTGVFQAGIPKPLFKVTPGVLYWDVTSDGKRFLMPAPSASDASVPFTVVLNWQAALKK